NARKAAGRRLTAVVARDPRISGHFLTAAVNAGLGLHRAMADHGISVETTGVNDRYALERMNAGRYSLGGEQSGHVIMSEFATTGDGLLTGLHLAAEMVRTGKSLAELASVMTVFPQLLINVRGVARSRAQDADVVAAVDAASAELGDSGRVLLRPSGTEELVRVMVEASTSDVASAVAERLAGVVRGE
ncbi:MAG TPA: phosphoglucosamine mutase, partial [Microbacterium sp.]|nr:phosphoglucosamine mutase [Microbacterium sp.]